MQTDQTSASGGANGQPPSSVAEVASQAQEKAQQVAGQAQERLQAQVDQRVAQLSSQVSERASDLHSVSDTLREQGKEGPAKAAEQLAGYVEKAGGYLQEKDAGTLLSDAEDLGRRQPWAVAAGGLALGFAASRFLKASSGRRYDRRLTVPEPAGVRVTGVPAARGVAGAVPPPSGVRVAGAPMPGGGTGAGTPPAPAGSLARADG
jgi:hypothetical protein